MPGTRRRKGRGSRNKCSGSGQANGNESELLGAAAGAAEGLSKSTDNNPELLHDSLEVNRLLDQLSAIRMDNCDSPAAYRAAFDEVVAVCHEMWDYATHLKWGDHFIKVVNMVKFVIHPPTPDNKEIYDALPKRIIDQNWGIYERYELLSHDVLLSILQIIAEKLDPSDCITLLHTFFNKVEDASSQKTYHLADLFKWDLESKDPDQTIDYSDYSWDQVKTLKATVYVLFWIVQRAKECLRMADFSPIFMYATAYETQEQKMAKLLMTLLPFSMALTKSTGPDMKHKFAYKLLGEVIQCIPINRLQSLDPVLYEKFIQFTHENLSNFDKEEEGLRLLDKRDFTLGVLISSIRDLPAECLSNTDASDSLAENDQNSLHSTILRLYGTAIIESSCDALFRWHRCYHGGLHHTKIRLVQDVGDMDVKILTHLAKHHFTELIPHLENILRLLRQAIHMALYVNMIVVRCNLVHAAHEYYDLPNLAMELFIAIIEGFCKLIRSGVIDPSDEIVPLFCEGSYNVYKCFGDIMETKHTPICSLMLDSIAAISEDLFVMLPENCRKYLMSVVLSCCNYVKNELRPRCARCIGCYLEFRSLSSDLQFFMDTFDSITNGITDNLPTFSWALGNWSDGLVKHYMGDQHALGYLTDIKYLKTVHMACCVIKKDRCNGYRAAGNYLRWLPANLLENPEYREKVIDMLTTITKQVGRGCDFKARWNASHTLGNIFLNEELLEAIDTDIITRVIESLLKSISHSENFKERIQSLSSVSRVKARKYFGNSYISAWVKVLTATARVPDQFSDCIPKMEIHMGLTLARLTTMLEIYDLTELEEMITDHFDNYDSAIRYAKAHSPQDGNELIRQADEALERLKEGREFTSQQNSVMEALVQPYLE